MRSVDFDLYLVTDRKTTGGRDLMWVLEQALEGGVRAVQLREKDLGGAALLELARRVKRLCDRYGAELFINDRVDVALAADAAGVHLAATSMPLEVARGLLGPDRKIGVSTHSPAEVHAAAEAGADFVLFGPIYPTTSKLPFGDPQGPAALKTVTDAASVPVFAIGGIKQHHLPEIKAHGTARIASPSSPPSPKPPTPRPQPRTCWRRCAREPPALWLPQPSPPLDSRFRGNDDTGRRRHFVPSGVLTQPRFAGMTGAGGRHSRAFSVIPTPSLSFPRPLCHSHALSVIPAPLSVIPLPSPSFPRKRESRGGAGEPLSPTPRLSVIRRLVYGTGHEYPCRGGFQTRPSPHPHDRPAIHMRMNPTPIRRKSPGGTA